MSDDEKDDFRTGIIHKKMFFIILKKGHKRIEQKRLQSMKVYRHLEEKEEKNMKAVFAVLEDLVLNRRVQALNGCNHYENALGSRGFDAIMNFGLQTRQYKERIVMFYYRYLLKKYFQNLQMNVQTQKCQRQEKGRLVQKMRVQNFFLKMCKKGNKKKHFHHFLSALCQKIEQKQRQFKVQGFLKMKEGELEEKDRRAASMYDGFGKQNLYDSRKTFTNFQDLSVQSRRRFTPITSTIQLPNFTNSRSRPHIRSPIKQQPLLSPPIKNEPFPLVSHPPPVTQKPASSDKNRILSLIAQCKVAELNLLPQMKQSENYRATCEKTLRKICNI